MIDSAKLKSIWKKYHMMVILWTEAHKLPYKLRMPCSMAGTNSRSSHSKRAF